MDPTLYASSSCYTHRQSPEEETIHNDYNAYFVDSGLQTLPGTWVENTALETRFSEYVVRLS